MRPPALAASFALLLAALAPRPSPTRTPAPPAGEDDERVEDAVRFATPAPEMRRLDAALGAGTFEETWNHPERFKRGDYDG